MTGTARKGDAAGESLFAHHAFIRLWFARLGGTAASQMLMIALGWQMYDLTGSAWDLGLVGLLQFLPSLALALPAGHLIDRVHRARLLSACLGVQVLVAGTLCVASAQGLVGRALLLGVSVALGALRAVQMPTQQALTPTLVPPALLPRALAFSSAGLQASIIAGPALGGVIYALGAAATYGSCVALFALAAVLTLGIRYRHVPQHGAATWATLLAGLHFIFDRKVVLAAVSLDLFAVLFGGATALLPIFAKDLLHVGPWGLGLLRAAPAAGALAVSIALTRWPIRRRVGRALLVAVAVYGVATTLFGLSKSFTLSLVLLAVSGGADMVNVVIRQTLVQLETPDAMRGRVSAVNAVFIGASNQLGEFESGATAALFGPVGSVVLGGVGTCLVAAAWWRRFPELAQRDTLQPAVPQQA